ncbi:hypothetical protein [Paenibacillus jilunlii]|uniref:CobQ/CobB/MinD/ParA nucleotide binding domain-containing protein n=1 Tax=Paenibacillus jilunlii TaxID=682956 RepID=A0A1G9LE59_9BACL|nr:hypothetical protein [Paenibacillus jilunlii]KWX74191.1 hypothetical protein AML91_15590 [Paenibacillus jilunlii]SDL60231.1 CobQ/CobB/MinD/ParA nucleotide binding domain-containing protein [Paenibacillus jilunlii]
MAARIVLAVRESQYIEPLLHYIHHSEYGGMLRVSAFSVLDAFMEFMQGEEVPDAVVGDLSFIEAWLVEGRNSVPWAVLSDDGDIRGNPSGSLAGGQMIIKYQALPSLLESILQLCDLKRSRTASVPKEETLLLGVVSASGSSGKTTLALNMAKQLGGLGLSVFYLNLESVDSSGLFLRLPDGNAPGLERLLYELKASAGEGGQAQSGKMELEKYVIRHESLRAEAFRPVDNLKEKLEMTLTDTLDVLEELSGAGRYDVVIVDTGGIEEQQTQAVLHRCGLLLWVLTSDKNSMHKTGRWLEHCSRPHSGGLQEVQGKSRFVLNFAADAHRGEFLSEGLEMDAVLPYISSWATQHHGELCLNSPQFILGIQQLCSGIIEPALPRVFTGNGI